MKIRKGIVSGVIRLSFLLFTLVAWAGNQGIQEDDTTAVRIQEDTVYVHADSIRLHRSVPDELVPDQRDISLEGFVMPLKTWSVTSYYGRRSEAVHQGVDLELMPGDTVYACFAGTVRYVGSEEGYGEYVVLRHDNGLETVYGHLEAYLVSEGDQVEAGTPIALGGNTGRSTGPHLHLETLFAGRAINPAEMIDFVQGKAKSPSYHFVKSLRYDKLATGGGRRLRAHRVEDGDTLESLAEKYKVSVALLCRMNHLSANAKLTKGQAIRYM